MLSKPLEIVIVLTVRKSSAMLRTFLERQ